jgi:hypothetical protein
MREAAQDRRYERAAALLRRKERLAWVIERLDGVLRATHAAPRLALARHPVKDRFDAFWIVQGRLVDWGPLPGPSELERRTAEALSRPRGRTVIPTTEIDEVRIVAGWLAEHEPPLLELSEHTRAPALMRFVAAATPAARESAPLPASGSRASSPATSS